MDLLVVVPHVDDRMAEMVRLSRVLSPLRLPVDLLVVSSDAFEYWCHTPGNIDSAVRVEGKVLYEQAH